MIGLRRFSGFLVACGLAWGCGSAGPPPPAHHQPLARADWESRMPVRQLDEPRSERDDADRDDADRDDAAGSGSLEIRPAMIAAGEDLVSSGSSLPDFGASDLDRILSGLLPGLGWSSAGGLRRLVEIARSRGAYETDGDPEPGDVVLFHNQRDANGNGKVDDWLSGCGIVLERDGPRFVSAVRTGHAPRRAVVWPDGPGRRVVDGEVVNSYLRVPHRSDPAGTPYLAGRMYAGHIDIEELAAGGGS
ncbi:MAG: hypothetical protein R6V85_06195 [Polyangia bacterium]